MASWPKASPARGLLLSAAILAVVAAASMVAAGPAAAQDNPPLSSGIQTSDNPADSADRIVKTMSDYVAAQGNISLTYDSDIEVTTREMQKIQFSSSGKVQLSRPDKLRLTRVGGYVDFELVYNGEILTLFGRNMDVFTQAPVTGSVADLVDRLRDEHNVDLPGADLLSSNAHGELMADDTDAKHIGRGVVDGIECEHIAARGDEVDWQLWVEVGPRPIPRKYVITSKHVTGSPQYTVRVRDWNTDPQPETAFTFKPPSGARMVEVVNLPHLDDVPESAPYGGSR